MDADIHKRYESDFYRIFDFLCKCKDCRTSKPEYSESFSISFIRKGNFVFNVFRNSLDCHTSRVLVTKPGYERTVAHKHTIPDECTIFDFKNGFYDEIKASYPTLKFIFNNDAHASLVKTTAEAEVLHQRALALAMGNGAGKLGMDSLVLEIVENILGKVGHHGQDAALSPRLKKYHLTTVENAKAYMLRHFQNDISLMELARHCHVSPFHFSRIFKKITAYSPHQFLATVRLKNSELLIKETKSSIMDIALQSGYNSVEHFTTSFTKKFGVSPAAYRASL